MIVAQDFLKGQFSYNNGSVTVPVDFNPTTLDYTITLNTQGEGGNAQQAAGGASAKLTMELLFDTTDTGDDVRTKTNKVELMLKPQAGTGPSGPTEAPPMVTFEWGAFKFIGVIDSFKQTMDFFAPSGVPLRAAVSLSMAQPKYLFDQKGATRDNKPVTAGVDQSLVVGGGNAFQLATAAGDPSAARGIALSNGLESLRTGGGAEISVGGGVSIGAAASFSAGGGAGFGIGAGISLGAGAGMGGGAGISASFGATSSAGVAASSGAFSGLRAGISGGAGKFLEPQRLLASVSAPGVAPGATFDVTGKAIAGGASGFKADVGASRGLRFDT